MKIKITKTLREIKEEHAIPKDAIFFPHIKISLWNRMMIKIENFLDWIDIHSDTIVYILSTMSILFVLGLTIGYFNV